MFQKEYPDPFKFSKIAEQAFDFVGGIENDPVQLLALSWLAKGVVTVSDNEYVTDTGRTLTIEVGESWGSIESIREDILAATGTEYSDKRVRYAVKRAERDKLITSSRLALPETNGRYGKIYRVSNDILIPEKSVVEAYHLFYYDNPENFNTTEVVTRHKGNRRIQKSAFDLVHYVAKYGQDFEGYRRIGFWREGETLDPSAPVYLPYLIIDLDRIVLIDAYEAATEIVQKLLALGFDPDSIFVAYSGRRGFHVYIMTNQLGSPIFINSEAAKTTIDRFVSTLFPEIEVDGHTHSPLSLVRLTGSVHNTTGHRKRIFKAENFLERSFKSLMWKPEELKKFTMPDPYKDANRDDAYELFMDTVHKIEQEVNEKRKSIDVRSSNRLGSKMKAIVGGVSESECWSNDKCGRDWAAYVMACWLVESPRQAKQVADTLNIVEKDSWEILKEWNKHNDPPLSESVLRNKYRSGVNTIGETI